MSTNFTGIKVSFKYVVLAFDSKSWLYYNFLVKLKEEIALNPIALKIIFLWFFPFILYFSYSTNGFKVGIYLGYLNDKKLTTQKTETL